MVTSDNENSICGGDAPVNSINTDEQKAKILIVGNPPVGLVEAASLTDVSLVTVEETKKDIERLDLLLSETSYVKQLMPYMSLPDLPVFGGEKKKKKSCTYHEYTEHRQKAGDNYIISKWACRHCGRVL